VGSWASLASPPLTTLTLVVRIKAVSASQPPAGTVVVCCYCAVVQSSPQAHAPTPGLQNRAQKTHECTHTNTRARDEQRIHTHTRTLSRARTDTHGHAHTDLGKGEEQHSRLAEEAVVGGRDGDYDLRKIDRATEDGERKQKHRQAAAARTIELRQFSSPGESCERQTRALLRPIISHNPSTLACVFLLLLLRVHSPVP
jgi:hypothetical protein